MLTILRKNSSRTNAKTACFMNIHTTDNAYNNLEKGNQRKI